MKSLMDGTKPTFTDRIPKKQKEGRAQRNLITFHTSKGHMEYNIEEDPNISVDMCEMQLIVQECLSEEVFFDFISEFKLTGVDEYHTWNDIHKINDNHPDAAHIKKAFNSTVRVLKQDLKQIHKTQVSDILKAIENL